MPRHINGFGSKFYGKREFRSDNSFITTEWVILYFVPIIPLKSLRVRYLGREEIKRGYADNYEVLEKTGLSFHQVVYMYGFVVFLFAWLALLIWVFWKHAADVGVVGKALLVVGFLVPFLAPHYLQKWGKAADLKREQDAINAAKN